MTHADIRQAAEAMDWDLTETVGYHNGNIMGEAQDAADLILAAQPDAGFVFGFLASGVDAIPVREAVVGVRLDDNTALTRFVKFLELSTDRAAAGEAAFFAYVDQILENFNSLVERAQQGGYNV